MSEETKTKSDILEAEIQKLLKDKPKEKQTETQSKKDESTKEEVETSDDLESIEIEEGVMGDDVF